MHGLRLGGSCSVPARAARPSEAQSAAVAAATESTAGQAFASAFRTFDIGQVFHKSADCYRPFDKIPRMGIALCVIGIEQAVSGDPIDHKRQLPAQIDDITHTRVHPLA